MSLGECREPPPEDIKDIVGGSQHSPYRVYYRPLLNRALGVAITRTGSSSHYEITCCPRTHSQWVRFGNVDLSYDADDTKWVPWARMGSGTHFVGQNGFSL